MRIAAAAILAAILLAGCGGSKGFVLNQKYESKDFSDKVLLIAPIAKDAVKILNKDDIADDFPGDKREPEVIMKDLVYKSITSSAKYEAAKFKLYSSQIDSSLFISQQDKDRYFSIKAPVDEDQVYSFFYVPKKEVLFSRDIKPDLILLVNRLKFSRGAVQGYKYSSEAIKAEYEYIIYDYNLSDIVAVGSYTVDVPFSLAMTRSDWDRAVKKIGAEFFQKTPFSKL